MANVFTKKHHRPRTTTLSDFGPFSRFTEGRPLLPRRARVLSPTRRQNPHPTGLVSQKPYNKDMLTFDIWNPDFVKISRRMEEMIGHLDHANFCCGKMMQAHEKSRLPPEVPYDISSTTRTSYQTPVFPKEHLHLFPKPTRFGYTPKNAAIGIVPNSLPSIYKPPGQHTCLNYKQQ